MIGLPLLLFVTFLFLERRASRRESEAPPTPAQPVTPDSERDPRAHPDEEP